MLGLALLAKLTAVVPIPGLALVILFRMFQIRLGKLGLGKWLKRSGSMIAGVTVGALLVSGWWFVRNVFVYGEPSGTKAEAGTVASARSPRPTSLTHEPPTISRAIPLKACGDALAGTILGYLEKFIMFATAPP